MRLLRGKKANLSDPEQKAESPDVDSMMMCDYISVVTVHNYTLRLCWHGTNWIWDQHTISSSWRAHAVSHRLLYQVGLIISVFVRHTVQGCLCSQVEAVLTENPAGPCPCRVLTRERPTPATSLPTSLLLPSGGSVWRFEVAIPIIIKLSGISALGVWPPSFIQQVLLLLGPTWPRFRNSCVLCLFSHLR